MSGNELVSDFLGYLAISVILFVLLFFGAALFGKNIPASQIAMGAGAFGLGFYALFRGVSPKH